MPSLDPRAGVIGVYDRPAAEGSDIHSVRLEDSGIAISLALQGAKRLTRLRDRITSELEGLLN